jgi:hypothetical protein
MSFFLDISTLEDGTHTLARNVGKNPTCATQSSLQQSSERLKSRKAYIFLGSRENSAHFMEPEGSLLWSQEPATCPYPKLGQCIISKRNDL